ncbi:hypothetical protein LTR86_004291 [Recurvomyces mirabilis]|nr:hypothetical protein LTR86_004291 [Recurvomyces mirabilis]
MSLLDYEDEGEDEDEDVDEDEGENGDDEDNNEADNSGELDQNRSSDLALIEDHRSRGTLMPSAARAIPQGPIRTAPQVTRTPNCRSSNIRLSKPKPFRLSKETGVKHSKHNAGSRTWGKAPDHSNVNPLKAQEDKKKRRIERTRRMKLALVSRPARYEGKHRWRRLSGPDIRILRQDFNRCVVYTDGSSKSSRASGLGVAYCRPNGIWNGLSITLAPDDNNKAEYQAITAALVAVLRFDLLRAGQSLLILTDSESALRKIYESDRPRRWDEQQQVHVLDPISEAPLETEVEFAHTFRRGQCAGNKVADKLAGWASAAADMGTLPGQFVGYEQSEIQNVAIMAEGNLNKLVQKYGSSPPAPTGFQPVHLPPLWDYQTLEHLRVMAGMASQYFTHLHNLSNGRSLLPPAQSSFGPFSPAHATIFASKQLSFPTSQGTDDDHAMKDELPAGTNFRRATAPGTVPRSAKVKLPKDKKKTGLTDIFEFEDDDSSWDPLTTFRPDSTRPRSDLSLIEFTNASEEFELAGKSTSTGRETIPRTHPSALRSGRLQKTLNFSAPDDGDLGDFPTSNKRRKFA